MGLLNSLKNFRNRNKFIYVDIDKSFFIKPISHWVYYRRSASGKHFHLKFKREWLEKVEIFDLLAQCDKSWLIHQIIQRKFKVAKKKDGKKAHKWKKTCFPYPIHILRDCGSVTKHYIEGYRVFDYKWVQDQFLIIYKWELKARKELLDYFPLMPEDWKKRNGSYFGDYEDYDEGDDLDDFDDYYDEDWDDMDDDDYIYY